MEIILNHNTKQTGDSMLYDYIFKCIEIVCIDNIKLNKSDYIDLLKFVYYYNNIKSLNWFHINLIKDILYIKGKEE